MSQIRRGQHISEAGILASSDASCPPPDTLDTAKQIEILSARMRAIADALDDLATGRRASPPEGRPQPGTFASLAGCARHYLRQRRQREVLFPPGIFGDPAWDLLLDLYVANIEGRQISVSSGCIAAAVPATTALRWICVLEQNGLILRLADPEDRRRIHLQLAPKSAELVGNWLAAMFGSGNADGS